MDTVNATTGDYNFDAAGEAHYGKAAWERLWQERMADETLYTKDLGEWGFVAVATPGPTTPLASGKTADEALAKGRERLLREYRWAENLDRWVKR